MNDPAVIAVYLNLAPRQVFPHRPLLAKMLFPVTHSWGALFARCCNAALAAGGVFTEPSPSSENDFGAKPPTHGVLCGLEGLWLFNVTSWRLGSAIILEEIRALHLIEGAKVSRFCPSEGIWRPVHPAGGPAFEPDKLLAELRQAENQ